MTDRVKATIVVGALAAAAAGLVGVGYRLGRPTPGKPESAAPEVKQIDDSVVAQRAATSPTARPKQVLPPGAKAERIVQVVVRPRTAATSGAAQPGKDCPASASGQMTIDLTLARMPDKSRRVIASSPDGEILNALDIPVEEPAQVEVPKWEVQALAGYDLARKRPVYGASVSRRLGPFTLRAGFIGSTVFGGAGLQF